MTGSITANSVSRSSISFAAASGERLTPEERAALRCRVSFQIACDRAHRVDRLGPGSIAGQQDVEVEQLALLEPFVEVADLLRGGFGAFDSSVTLVVA